MAAKRKKVPVSFDTETLHAREAVLYRRNRHLVEHYWNVDTWRDYEAPEGSQKLPVRMWLFHVHQDTIQGIKLSTDLVMLDGNNDRFIVIADTHEIAVLTYETTLPEPVEILLAHIPDKIPGAKRKR